MKSISDNFVKYSEPYIKFLFFPSKSSSLINMSIAFQSQVSIYSALAI